VTEHTSQYVAFDHTELERRRKKLWNIADGVPLTIVGGIDLRALVMAAGFFLGLVAITAGLSPLPVIDLHLWVIVVHLGLAALAYYLWPRRWRNGMTTEQNLLVAADYILLQPRRIHGLAADKEPEQLHWRVILWHPVGERWREELAIARSERQVWRSHPDDWMAARAAGQKKRRRIGSKR
jgi:hypothetical protein